MSQLTKPANRRRAAITALAIGLAVALVPAIPAAAGEIAWRTGSSSQGTYTEPSSVRDKWRTGVFAELEKFNGPFTVTTVWFGSYNSSGTNAANVKGPRSKTITKAAWRYTPAKNDTGKTPFYVALITSGTGGMRVANPGSSSAGTESVELGSINGVAFSKRIEGDTVHLSAEVDGFTGSTTATLDEFESLGVTLRFEGPLGVAQGHLIQPGTLTAQQLEEAGLTEVSEGFYASEVNAEAQVLEFSIANDFSRSAAGATTYRVPVFGAPDESEAVLTR